VVNARCAARTAAGAGVGDGEGHGKGHGKGDGFEKEATTVAEAGLLAACIAGGVREVQVLTSMGHSSLSKAASVVGLGRGSVKELGVSAAEPWRLDLDAVERELQREADGVVSIIVVSAGEVNTGRFATNVLDMPKLRSLADRHGAWIHVDGGMHSLYSFGVWGFIELILTNLAFGIFARVLPKTDEYLSLHANVAGLELADSIAADGHKLLNVVCYYCQSMTFGFRPNSA
jgi:glutamate/tyrosine decarboxylase-like PLP-dependent enzyme